MTNKELIEILTNFPGEYPVFVDGYEFGLWDIKNKNVFSVAVVLNYNEEDYAGPHAKNQDTSPGEGCETVMGIIISRKTIDE